MIILDYIMNLSIFSLMVIIPLVIQSLLTGRLPKNLRLWISLYAGIVSIILVIFSIHQQGYTFDIRYAPVILMFSYLGPIPGIITGLFSLLSRLYTGGNWVPAITTWLIIMFSFSVIHYYISRLSSMKKSIIFSLSYIAIYVTFVPNIFDVLNDSPLFHFQYLLFVILGVIVGGLLIESYLKLFRIISENKRMESTIEASESKYRLIAENTSDLIMIMNKEYAISYFSPSHEQILGYHVSELEGIELCEFLHPDDVEMFRLNSKKMFENRTSYSMEFRLKHKEGGWREFESRCMPVKGEEEDVEQIVLVSRDISERKKAEVFLLQSEKLSIVGELAAGVAHEIRNPLTTIKGFIQLYKKENMLNEYNDLLLVELERIETITSELLTLGKPQATQLNAENLLFIIENTLELLTPQAHMNNIQFKLRFKESAYFVTCEKNQIKQVFLNVLKNAMEAMEKGGDIDITLRKTQEGECVISFQDHGYGIPEELLPRLGEPFYSLKEKGTGLGLMICNKIIKQHYGSIHYTSKVNEGTLVEIHLPLASADSLPISLKEEVFS
ncbi:ATP-binding protein [Bacillus sp. PS06]|uniref:ATP-binding protein n=1 Tax=Bacillus sp. PS06 TaxID=2764176 RepID=UPI001782FB16|nr:ATP-binding protein [Bacillus sp. PS06]MBD8069554.1 PAS domain S-box protein [Bacillus sp. PS06]